MKNSFHSLILRSDFYFFILYSRTRVVSPLFSQEKKCVHIFIYFFIPTVHCPPTRPFIQNYVRSRTVIVILCTTHADRVYRRRRLCSIIIILCWTISSWHIKCKMFSYRIFRAITHYRYWRCRWPASARCKVHDKLHPLCYTELKFKFQTSLTKLASATIKYS